MCSDYIRNPKYPDMLKIISYADDISFSPPRTALIFILAKDWSDAKVRYKECLMRNSKLRARYNPQFEYANEIEDILFFEKMLPQYAVEKFEKTGSLFYGWLNGQNSN